VRALRSAQAEINKILSLSAWKERYKDHSTGRRVLSEKAAIEYDHELRTAICLAQMHYDIIFAPLGMFQRDQKKFDVYLIKNTVLLEADLKCITSMNPDTISKRIIGGSEQASRLVVDIRSNILSVNLIDGLRSGTEKNPLIKEILLLYRKRLYVLPKTLICSKRIFEVLKSEKGYT
jgi:hypothetical protein